MSDRPAPNNDTAHTPLSPDEHMAAAQRWLAQAEQLRVEIADAVRAEGGPHFIPRGAGYGLLFETARDLACEHREMATALWSAPAVTTSRWLTPDTEAMGERIREQLAADTEAHQSVTLSPGVDEEPPEVGSLWTFAEPDETAGELFWYAVTDALETHPSRGRWLMVRHYAQVLRWQNEQGAKPLPHTWSEIADETDSAPLRRPTADERSRFYGPEPDPEPAVRETHERTTTIPAMSETDADAYRRSPEARGRERIAQACDCCATGKLGQLEFNRDVWPVVCRTCTHELAAHRDADPVPSPEGPIRFDATVSAFGDDALAEMARAVQREQAKRTVERSHGQHPRGGAAQWREG